MASVRRWSMPAVFVLLAAVVVTQLARDGDTVSATVVGAALLVLAWFGSPVRGRRDPTHAEALRRAAHGEVVVYWRPGCPYCGPLPAVLPGRAGALWRNLWQRRGAAACMRPQN